MTKVKVFVDYSNFRGAWQDRKIAHAMPWPLFPDALGRSLTDLLSKNAAAPIDFRGVNVYASINPEERRPKEDEESEYWLRKHLDQLSGYTVKVYRRKQVISECERLHTTARYCERGVDTKIVCDMLALGMRNLYDVGVLVTEDCDLIPAVETVQDILDRQIVHVGFKKRGDALRSTCWSHLLLEDLIGQAKSGGRPRR